MGKAITGLKPQTKREDRVNVYLDGEFGFGLHRSLAESLQVGQQLSEQEIQRLERRDRQEAAFQRAVRSVARRPRSERELLRSMTRRGLEPAEAEPVIDRLREVGLADDLSFARAWIENRMTFRPRSALALKSELRGKGVSNRVIGQALEDFDERRAARLAAQAGARRYQHLSPDDFRRRLSAYMSRRGFDHHTVSPLVRELAGELAEESEEPS